MKKMLLIIIAIVILAVVVLLLPTEKEGQTMMETQTINETENYAKETTSYIKQEIDDEATFSESVATDATDSTESQKETWAMEILESRPDSITMEVEDKKSGEKLTVQMGVAEGDTPLDGDDSDVPSTEPKPAEVKPTEPKATEPKPTESKPSQPIPDGIKVEEPGADITFADYQQMSGEEQMLFFYSFADADAFNSWYEAAKAEYDAGKNDIVIGDDGVVNLG